MEKIIKCGFRPVNNNFVRRQNDSKGKKLFESDHDIIEIDRDNGVIILCQVVAQANVSSSNKVKIIVCIKKLQTKRIIS